VAQTDLPCFAKKTTGKGWACHMNVSLMEYAGIRAGGAAAAAAYSAPVTALLKEAGITPWIKLEMAGKEPDQTETTYWRKGDRVVVFAVKNLLEFASEFGEAKTEGIVEDTRDLTIQFTGKKDKVVDEMSGKDLGSGDHFTVPWKMDEAAMISFASKP